MKIQAEPSALTETRWYEYATRFVFGGVITAVAGVISMKYGPNIGGLFLAFPAIFPAGATLIEKHEKEKKEDAGLNGTHRAAQAVSADAAGASIGSLGLAVFGLFVWKALPNYPAWLVLGSATVAWCAASLLLWELRKRT
jgi:uncharacterized protein DUF3147